MGFPGLQVQNLKNALERGTVTHSYDHLMRPDLQVCFQQCLFNYSHITVIR